jgi:hypothetical protein
MPLADPPTANDEHEVATPVDPSSASLKRLSPATIKSLEALAALEISPVQDRSSTEPISTKSAARSSYIVTNRQDPPAPTSPEPSRSGKARHGTADT